MCNVIQHKPKKYITAGLRSFDKMSIDSRLTMEKLEAVMCQIQGLSGTWIQFKFVSIPASYLVMG